MARVGTSGAWGSFLVAGILLLFHTSSAAAFESLDLNSNWQITNKNGSIQLSSVQLPAYPVEELRKLGVVQDPQYR